MQALGPSTDLGQGRVKCPDPRHDHNRGEPQGRPSLRQIALAATACRDESSASEGDGEAETPPTPLR